MSSQVFLNATAGISSHPLYFHTVTYQLPRPLICQDGYQWRVSLNSMSIVSSQFVINEYNNLLKIGDINYYLTSGNYDASSLCLALASLTGKAFRYDSTTLKITMTSTTSTTLSGPMASDVLDFVIDYSDVTFTSLRTVKLTGVQSIYVDMNLQGNNITLRKTPTTTSLCRVNNNVPPLSTLHYFDNTPGIGNLLFDSGVYNFTIFLTDQDGNPLLVSAAYDLTLTFTPVYTGRQSMSVARPLGLSIPPPNNINV